MKRKPKKTTRRNSTAKAEAAGEQYAQTQLQSDYFMDWVREQLAEAADMDPSEVLPLETKADARVIAKNMLQQLEWDTKRDLNESKEFFAGFHRGLTNPSTVDWLADELLELKGQMRGEGMSEARRTGNVQRAPSTAHTYVWQISLQVTSPERPNLRHQVQYRVQALSNAKEDAIEKAKELAARDGYTVVDVVGAARGYKLKETAHRVRDYIAVDRRDRPVGPRHKGYSDAKRDADNAGGTVKFVPSSKRAPVREMRRPKAGRSVTRRRR